MYINLQETGDIGAIVVGSFVVVVVVGAGAAKTSSIHLHHKIRVS